MTAPVESWLFWGPFFSIKEVQEGTLPIYVHLSCWTGGSEFLQVLTGMPRNISLALTPMLTLLSWGIPSSSLPPCLPSQECPLTAWSLLPAGTELQHATVSSLWSLSAISKNGEELPRGSKLSHKPGRCCLGQKTHKFLSSCSMSKIISGTSANLELQQIMGCFCFEEPLKAFKVLYIPGIKHW